MNIKQNTFISAFLMLLAVTVVNAQSTYSNAVISLNPVAYWPLQETAQPPVAQIETNYGSLGTVADAYYSSTNAIPGATGVTGDGDTSVFCSGASGGFLAVPTTDSRVSLTNAGAFTVEAWVNPANFNGDIGMVSQAGSNPGGLNGSTYRGGWVLSQNYYAYIDNNNLRGWSFHVYNGQGAANGQPQGGAEAGVSFNYATNTWYHLVGVFDGTNCTLYVNGTNASAGYGGYQIPMTGSYVPDTWDPLTIGCGRGINANLFAGGIDEVAIYTNALTAAQVAAHYAAASGSSYANTVLANNPYMYWRMDAPVYTPPDMSAYPVAANYGTVANLNGLYLSGTLPGMPGPAYSGFGSSSYACAFNGIGTDATNGIPEYTNGVLFATNVANTGVMITNLPDSLNLASNSITAMCWFKGNPANSRYEGLFGHGNGSWKMSLNSNGHVRWTSGLGGDFESAGDYNDGKWHFVVGVYDNSGVVDPSSGGWLATNYIYVDGVLDGSELVTNVTASGNTINALLGGVGDYTLNGNGNSYNQRYFSGSLAQCAYFTNALTASQVVDLYTSAGATSPPPTITAQPYPYPSVRIVTGGVGTYIYEAVVAYGGSPDLGYSWYYNSSSNYAGATSLTDGVKYSGSATSQITITNLANGDSGYYYAVVNNNYGTATSSIVDVQVVASPDITAQSPTGPFTLFTGQSPSLSVTANGAADLVYQWLTNGMADATAGTNASYTLPADQAQSGETFQCVVTNDYGAATSAVATLTVQALPSKIANSPYATNLLALSPTVYFPMHETKPSAPGDIETNYGTLGALGTAYYADWNVNNGNPDSTWFIHQIPGALVNDPDTASFLLGNNGGNGNSHLLIPHISPQTTLKPPFTIEFWIYPNNDDFGDIISQDGTWLNAGNATHQNTDGIRIVWNRGNIQLYGNATIATTATALALNQWHHVALTYDGTNMYYYLDGNRAASGTTTSFTPDYWDPLLIGAGFWKNSGGGNYNIPFGIDEVAIYNTNLDQGTIDSHYAAGNDPASYGAYMTNILAANPVLYYRMDAPIYTTPDMSTWSVMTNYGTAAINGVYAPGTVPGSVSGPNNDGGLFALGLSGTNAVPCNGLSTFAEAYDPDAFDPAGPDTPFTVSLCFKGNPADASRYQSLTSEGTGWEINQGQDGRLQFYLSTAFNSQGVYNDGNWHQVVVTYSTNVLTMYVDGVLDNTATNSAYTNPPPDTVDYTGIGCDTRYLTNSNNGGSGRQYAGDVCDFAFWNGTALDASQVQTLYNASGTPPLITQQPVSATVNQNKDFTNTVVATGSNPLAYQWYKDNAPIDNQTNASLILNPVEAGDQANYYAVVANSDGSVTSAVVSLTVNTLPVIINSIPIPYTNLFTLYAGVSPTFTISARGATPLYYFWFTNGVAVGGATGTNFTLTNVLASFTNYCVVSNSLGTATNVWAATVIPDPTATYPQTVLSNSPIGYWRLNEPDNNGGSGPNDGVICHDYAGGNDGVYTNLTLGNLGYNSTADTSAQFGEVDENNNYGDSQAYQIAGIDFSSPTNTSKAFTVEAWVNGYQQNFDAGIVTKGYGNGGEQFCLGFGNNATVGAETFRFLVRDASGVSYSVLSSVAPTFGDWHHLVGVCDEVNGSVVLYIDGAAVGTTTIPPGSGILASTNLMTIGSRMSSATTNYNYQFYGNANDVAVYNYALSSSQVAAQYFAADIPPIIIQQPPASTNVDENGTLIVSAAATGTPPLSYQWYNSGTSQAVPDQTNATLIISNIQASAIYHLTVTNPYGYGSTNSADVSVNLISGAPVIVQDLPPHVTTASGRPYIYSVQAVGTEPFSYQWYNGATLIVGQTNSTYSFNAAPGNYSVVITNVDGGPVTSTISILTVVSLSTNAYATNILGLNPVGYWPLQETNTPAPANMETNYGTLGALGNGYYPGTNANTTVSFGQSGALTNSGDNDLAVSYAGGNASSYLFVPHDSPALTLKAPLTYECWVNPASGGPFGDIMGQGGAGENGGNWGGIRISYQTGGQLQAYLYNGIGVNYTGPSTAAGFLTLNQWHQCVMTYDGTTCILYVDGKQEASGTDAEVPSDSVPLTIGTGRWDEGPSRSFQGLMDEVAVYTNVLTPLQITNHYLAAITPGSNYMQTVENDNPLLYYRMDNTYTNPSPLTYPVAVNFGSSPVNGLYESGITPGGVAGPAIPGLGTNSVAAPINGAYSCVDAGYDPEFNPTGIQPFTAMTWFRGNPADYRVQAIMGQGGNWAMNFDGTTGLIIWNLYSAGQVTSTSVVNDGNWHLIAGVYDGTNSYLYVDGTLNNSGVATGGLTGEANTDLFLGGDADYTFEQYNWGSRYFAGALAQAAFFTNALTAQQIQQAYNIAENPSGVNSNPTNIVFSTTGNQLTLSWPADHTGWTLQAQTNSLSVGISTNWVDVSGSAATNKVIIPFSLTNGSVFYRLVYPQ